jgi:hypothetical protein
VIPDSDSASVQSVRDPSRTGKWWLCPNYPPCPHGGIFHDLLELEDVPTCCVETCGCGKARP